MCDHLFISVEKRDTQKLQEECLWQVILVTYMQTYCQTILILYIFFVIGVHIFVIIIGKISDCLDIFLDTKPHVSYLCYHLIYMELP